mgnify:FL=1
MKIGLVYAMTGEIESLLTQENAQPLQTVAGVPFYQIRPDVIACAGGVSKVNAAMATQLLISLYQPDLVLNAGVAGCFEDMPIGSIVLAEGFLQHDVDTTAVGDPIGLVSTVNRVEFPTWKPEHCVEVLKRLGFSAVTGRVATGDWFAVKSSRAAWVRDTFSPLLVEMEGCAMAQVCLRNGVGFAAVKSVSDHLFSENQAAEYFDFGQALEKLGAVVLPLARALKEEEL